MEPIAPPHAMDQGANADDHATSIGPKGILAGI